MRQLKAAVLQKERDESRPVVVHTFAIPEKRLGMAEDNEALVTLVFIASIL
jgi:hypothetical protein